MAMAMGLRGCLLALAAVLLATGMAGRSAAADDQIQYKVVAEFRSGVRVYDGTVALEGGMFSIYRASTAPLTLSGRLTGATVRVTGSTAGPYTFGSFSGEDEIKDGKLTMTLRGTGNLISVSVDIAFPAAAVAQLPAAGAAAAGRPALPAQVGPAVEPIDEVYVAVKPAKVRQSPDVGSARVTTIEVGQKVQVLGRVTGQDWYLVGKDDQPLGYVVAGQLAPQAAAATAAPAVTASAAPAPAPALPAGLDFGRYHALVIGNDAYRGLPALHTAVADARAVAQILKAQYGFEVTLLTNASRAQILGALAKLRQKLTWDDNLLIYYAGHGTYDDASERGYWLPVDAASDDPSNWVSNADITDMLKAMAAKHVLVVADSCYSGTLTRGAATALRDADYLQRIVQKKARTVMTSGGLEPVADSGGSGHSVFTQAFLAALQANRGAVDGQALFATVREPVVLAAPQTPEYSNLRFAGHDGGDFVFVRR
jgi:hypothetical protein